ncbi:hypothetical protein HPB50_022965 [Hyalomma asiaticum]|uniref:Uncharacterized protein n=1 Tax=Hyalomma asiaticum TaxID=266040 RepID=A0ACB7S5Q9_HYAAI|nr:hypothetical protein HPB50_022965 [Hyalomma asiaticum]
MFFLDHGLYNFPPWMMLAADGVHPSFGDVSLLTWNIYNLILQLQKPVVCNWRDCAVLAEDAESQVTDSYARVVGRRSPDSDSSVHSGLRPECTLPGHFRLDRLRRSPPRHSGIRPSQPSVTLRHLSWGALRKKMSRPLQSLKCWRRNPAPKHRPAPALSPATPQAPRLVDTSPSARESGTCACSTPVSNRYDLRKRCGSARRVHAD